MIKDLIQGMDAEASRAVYKLIERALHTSIMVRVGSIPPPEVIAERGRHIKCAEGDQFWDEWQWESKPLFRLHTKHSPTRLKWAVEFFTEDGESLGLGTSELQPDTSQ